ncbi:hypothetical protein [Thermobrachium celere]|uniref:Uncharacterized protein n=1 Tax=Thermobrachium celere DSM 8682 TaxID=941824 RepID=R7RS58_9CLOT|nr:hypothetical protein [Thermobrachium celere]CDF58226.1 hypothetical protein TCEL_00272 [Thermobrachium celere DSM 8682]
MYRFNFIHKDDGKQNRILIYLFIILNTILFLFPALALINVKSKYENKHQNTYKQIDIKVPQMDFEDTEENIKNYIQVIDLINNDLMDINSIEFKENAMQILATTTDYEIFRSFIEKIEENKLFSSIKLVNVKKEDSKYIFIIELR